MPNVKNVIHMRFEQQQKKQQQNRMNLSIKIKTFDELCRFSDRPNRNSPIYNLNECVADGHSHCLVILCIMRGRY